ncbi:hypothetical protein LTS18_014382, partial [Coniosporium uncinatum]
MEVRRIGDALLRSQQSPIYSFLYPRWAITPKSPSGASRQTRQYTLTSSRQQQAAAARTPEPEREEEDRPHQQTPKPSPQVNNPKSRTAADDAFRTLLDNTIQSRTPTSSSSRHSRYASAAGRQQSRDWAGMSDFAGLNNQSSAEAARNAMRQQQRGATPFGAAFSTPPSSNRGRSRSGDRGVADLFDNMIQPKS